MTLQNIALLLIMIVVDSGAHNEASSSDTDLTDTEDTSDDMEKEQIERRMMAKREWQYEGLPIEFSPRRIDKDVNNNISTTTTTQASPPLDRRYRRIYNADEAATIDQYPFMAALLVNKQLWCGAVIVDTDSVLTAAHCLQLQHNNRFFREYAKMLAVRVGSTNATSGGELLGVTEIFFHPNYKPQTLEFNFALIKLHRNISLGRHEPRVEKIEYTRDRIVPVNKNIVFLGWGSVLNSGGVGGQVLLQKLELPVYDLADCRDIYGRDLVTRSNFCAGYITKAKNVCNHDAGGPAILDGVLVGILSFSAKRCDELDKPAVFSNVGIIAPWLDAVGEQAVKLRGTALKSSNWIANQQIKQF